MVVFSLQRVTVVRMGRPPLPENEAKGSVVNIRVQSDVSARLDALVAKYPLLTKHAIARAALEKGLTIIEQDPSWFVAEPKEPPRKRTTKKQRAGLDATTEPPDGETP